MAEEEVRKLEKKFKEGSQVRVRIHGFRHLEGLATGILKVAFLLIITFEHQFVGNRKISALVEMLSLVDCQ